MNNDFKFDMYAVRDVKTGFLSPFCETNEATARRSFARAIASPDALMHSNPEDFSLYRVGTFYPDSGEIDDCLPQLICQAVDFVKE